MFKLMQAILYSAKSPETIRQLYAQVQGKNYYFSAALAFNPNTPADILEELANHPSSWVRTRLTQNVAISNGLLAVLCEDLDPYIADLAFQQLNERLANELVAHENQENSEVEAEEIPTS